MPAPSVKEILKFEAAVLTAWQTILERAGIPKGATFYEFTMQNAVTPRLEINIAQIKPTGHRGQFLPGQFTFDAWQANLTTKVITRRNLNGQTHDDFLSVIRMVPLYFFDAFKADVLPWHVMTKIEEGGSHRMIDPTRDEDITEVTHTVLLSVRAGAWPSKE
jgi:hypothetical protein